MKDTRLLDRFNEAKQILCRYDYYIHIPKKILHLTNTELKIPHLMGLQYIAGEGMFEGDRGAYMIKSGRLQYNSITKLVRKYYKKAEKQESITAMVYGKSTILHGSGKCWKQNHSCTCMTLRQTRS